MKPRPSCRHYYTNFLPPLPHICLSFFVKSCVWNEENKKTLVFHIYNHRKTDVTTLGVSKLLKYSSEVYLNKPQRTLCISQKITSKIFHIKDTLWNTTLWVLTSSTGKIKLWFAISQCTSDTWDTESVFCVLTAQIPTWYIHPSTHYTHAHVRVYLGTCVCVCIYSNTSVSECIYVHGLYTDNLIYTENTVNLSLQEIVLSSILKCVP